MSDLCSIVHLIYIYYSLSYKELHLHNFFFGGGSFAWGLVKVKIKVKNIYLETTLPTRLYREEEVLCFCDNVRKERTIC